MKAKLVIAFLKIVGVLNRHVTSANIKSRALKADMIGDSDSWTEETRFIPFQLFTHKFDSIGMQAILDNWDSLKTYFSENGI